MSTFELVNGILIGVLFLAVGIGGGHLEKRINDIRLEFLTAPSLPVPCSSRPMVGDIVICDSIGPTCTLSVVCKLVPVKTHTQIVK